MTERPEQVVVAVLREGDRVLLCHRSPSRRWYPDVWDLPGGHVEPGETPAAALVRELAEELGITIDEPLSPPFAVVSTDEFRMAVWVLDAWDGDVRNAAVDEHDDLGWFDVPGLSSLALAHPQYRSLLSEVLASAT